MHDTHEHTKIHLISQTFGKHLFVTISVGKDFRIFLRQMLSERQPLVIDRQGKVTFAGLELITYKKYGIHNVIE